MRPDSGTRGTLCKGLTIGLVTLALLLCGIRSDAQSQIWYVDESSSGFSGTSWADALGDLQEAMFLALPGDEIRVAGGNYSTDAGGGLIPGDPSTRFVLPGGVILRGGFAGVLANDPDHWDPYLYKTVLDGQIQGIHVSTMVGIDTPFCGLSRELPCATLQQGIERAVETGLKIVRVQAGTYGGPSHWLTISSSREDTTSIGTGLPQKPPVMKRFSLEASMPMGRR